MSASTAPLLEALCNPSLTTAKQQLADLLGVQLCREKYTVTEAASVTGLREADIQRILSGRVQRYTLDRLLEAYQRLCPDAPVTIRLDLPTTG